MPTTHEASILDRAIDALSTVVPFELSNLKGFPSTTYQEQVELYVDLEKWFHGTVWDEGVVDSKTGKLIEKYPIKINPLPSTARKHTASLLGVSLDSIRFGGVPVQVVADPSEKAKKALGKELKAALQKIFADSLSGSLFVQNGIASQYLGGCVFLASWQPDQKKIQISAPDPWEFIGIPMGNDFWNLRECWIVREVKEEDLARYGYEKVGLENKWWYIEHWTRTEYSISINQKVLEIDDTPLAGPNPFGVVPAVYIPHIRDGNAFIGRGIVSMAVKGILRELNLRWADTGDAVSADSHQIIYSRNIQGNISARRLTDGRVVQDVGQTNGLAGNSDPEILSVDLKSASETMLSFDQDLYKLYRREVDHPAVADGEDEGSQRSALTLNVRMWPLQSHVEQERLFWSSGLITLAKILLKMAAVKKVYGVTEEMLNVSLMVEWSPMLPKDREQLVNELAIRGKNKIGSLEHLMALSGDIHDPEEEINKIRSELDLYQVQTTFNNNGKSNTGTSSPSGQSSTPKA